MHVKKRYENAGATKLALQHAQSVADKVAAAVKEKTGIEPTIGLNGSRIDSQGGLADTMINVRIGNVGTFNPYEIDPNTIDPTLVNISPNKDGAFDITVDVTAVSENKTEATDIANARKIQAGLVEMEEMLAAVGHNVSFKYDAENDIVEISVNNRTIVKKSVEGDSAVTAMNDVWTSTYRHLI